MAWLDQRSRDAVARGVHRRQHSIEGAELDKAVANMRKRDKGNTRHLKEIVAKNGWPGRSLVGAMGAQMAWLLVQHATHDLDFQRSCLHLLKAAVQEREAEASQEAYLLDRIRVAEGLPQLYGTQLDETMNALPIENVANVDQRRAEVGLEPLDQYLDRVRAWHASEAGSMRPAS